MRVYSLLLLLVTAGLWALPSEAKPRRGVAQQNELVPGEPVSVSSDYCIQVGAYRDQGEAQELASELWRERGYEDVRIEETDLPNNGHWFRVVVGTFPKKTLAEDYAKEKDMYKSFSELWIRPVNYSGPRPRTQPPAEKTVVAQNEVKEVKEPKEAKPKKAAATTAFPPVAPPAKEPNYFRFSVGYGLEYENLSQSGDWGAVDSKELDFIHVLAKFETLPGYMPHGLSWELNFGFTPSHLPADSANPDTKTGVNLFSASGALRYRGLRLGFGMDQSPIAQFATSTTLNWNKSTMLGPFLSAEFPLYHANHNEAFLKLEAGLPLVSASDSALSLGSATGYYMGAELGAKRDIEDIGLDVGAYLDFRYRSFNQVSTATTTEADIRTRFWTLGFGLTLGKVL